MTTPYTAPTFASKAFNCPFCGAYANQRWSTTVGDRSGLGTELISDLTICTCIHCKRYSVWQFERMISPTTGGVAMPNSDLPDDIKVDYEEARAILNLSPRGAAALLRLCIQKICILLGEKGNNINDDIGNLVRKGLPSQIQQALDVVRVVGNYAVHPGKLDLKDDVATASKMFDLINIIANVMITQPNEINRLFGELPENQLAGIAKRDQKNP